MQKEMVAFYRWIQFALLGVLWLLTGCSEEEIVYPSYKQAFLSAYSGARGTVEQVLPDDGPMLEVAEDRSGTVFKADTVVRVIANYGELSGNRAIIYGMGRVIAPVPEPADSPLFKDGIHTDPVRLQAVWMGRDYLNLVFLVRVKDQKHFFHVIEERVSEENGNKAVDLLLYHDAGNDLMAFSQPVYISVPLAGYAMPAGQTEVCFFYYNEDKHKIKLGPFAVKYGEDLTKNE